LSKARKENKNTYPLAHCIESTLEKPKGKIKNVQSRDTGNIGNKTKDRRQRKLKRIQRKKLKHMSNTDPTKNRGGIQVIVMDKQFLLLIRQPPCYLY
jgi:hypothetical protein